MDISLMARQVDATFGPTRPGGRDIELLGRNHTASRSAGEEQHILTRPCRRRLFALATCAHPGPLSVLADVVPVRLHSRAGTGLIAGCLPPSSLCTMRGLIVYRPLSVILLVAPAAGLQLGKMRRRPAACACLRRPAPA
jgi:hypothetical protein